MINRAHYIHYPFVDFIYERARHPRNMTEIISARNIQRCLLLLEKTNNYVTTVMFCIIEFLKGLLFVFFSYCVILSITIIYPRIRSRRINFCVNAAGQIVCRRGYKKKIDW